MLPVYKPLLSGYLIFAALHDESTNYIFFFGATYDGSDDAHLSNRCNVEQESMDRRNTP
jgi:hypothetical protein